MNQLASGGGANVVNGHSDLADRIRASIGLRRSALERAARARAIADSAEERARAIEVQADIGLYTGLAFVIDPGAEPLERRFYYKEYWDDGEDLHWTHHKTEEVRPGEPFTAPDAYSGTYINYERSVIRVEMRGDPGFEHGSSLSGSKAQSIIEIPFDRLDDVQIIEFYPRDPEKTRAVCAALAAKLGLEQVVLRNSATTAWETAAYVEAERAAGREPVPY